MPVQMSTLMTVWRFLAMEPRNYETRKKRKTDNKKENVAP